MRKLDAAAIEKGEKEANNPNPKAIKEGVKVGFIVNQRGKEPRRKYIRIG
jgi:hypothetical protein